eukprot:GDKJ01057868.1.p1 GENE.GDKJ01057868.1~~GDKJ01057868.1.p1  ORF type:complete len:1651 (-),score=396.59 GDKJ01057868.1:50-4402(-)
MSQVLCSLNNRCRSQNEATSNAANPQIPFRQIFFPHFRIDEQYSLIPEVNVDGASDPNAESIRVYDQITGDVLRIHKHERLFDFAAYGDSSSDLLWNDYLVENDDIKWVRILGSRSSVGHQRIANLTHLMDSFSNLLFDSTLGGVSNSSNVKIQTHRAHIHRMLLNRMICGISSSPIAQEHSTFVDHLNQLLKFSHHVDERNNSLRIKKKEFSPPSEVSQTEESELEFAIEFEDTASENSSNDSASSLIERSQSRRSRSSSRDNSFSKNSDSSGSEDDSISKSSRVELMERIAKKKNPNFAIVLPIFLPFYDGKKATFNERIVVRSLVLNENIFKFNDSLPENDINPLQSLNTNVPQFSDFVFSVSSCPPNANQIEFTLQEMQGERNSTQGDCERKTWAVQLKTIQESEETIEDDCEYLQKYSKKDDTKLELFDYKNSAVDSRVPFHEFSASAEFPPLKPVEICDFNLIGLRSNISNMIFQISSFYPAAFDPASRSNGVTRSHSKWTDLLFAAIKTNDTILIANILKFANKCVRLPNTPIMKDIKSNLPPPLPLPQAVLDLIARNPQKKAYLKSFSSHIHNRMPSSSTILFSKVLVNTSIAHQIHPLAVSNSLPVTQLLLEFGADPLRLDDHHLSTRMPILPLLVKSSMTSMELSLRYGPHHTIGLGFKHEQPLYDFGPLSLLTHKKRRYSSGKSESAGFKPMSYDVASRTFKPPRLAEFAFLKKYDVEMNSGAQEGNSEHVVGLFDYIKDLYMSCILETEKVNSPQEPISSTQDENEQNEESVDEWNLEFGFKFEEDDEHAPSTHSVSENGDGVSDLPFPDAPLLRKPVDPVNLRTSSPNPIGIEHLQIAEFMICYMYQKNINLASLKFQISSEVRPHLPHGLNLYKQVQKHLDASSSSSNQRRTINADQLSNPYALHPESSSSFSSELTSRVAASRLQKLGELPLECNLLIFLLTHSPERMKTHSSIAYPTVAPKFLSGEEISLNLPSDFTEKRMRKFMKMKEQTQKSNMSSIVDKFQFNNSFKNTSNFFEKNMTHSHSHPSEGLLRLLPTPHPELIELLIRFSPQMIVDGDARKIVEAHRSKCFFYYEHAAEYLLSCNRSFVSKQSFGLPGIHNYHVEGFGGEEIRRKLNSALELHLMSLRRHDDPINQSVIRDRCDLKALSRSDAENGQSVEEIILPLPDFKLVARDCETLVGLLLATDDDFKKIDENHSADCELSLVSIAKIIRNNDYDFQEIFDKNLFKWHSLHEVKSCNCLRSDFCYRAHGFERGAFKEIVADLENGDKKNAIFKSIRFFLPLLKSREESLMCIRRVALDSWRRWRLWNEIICLIDDEGQKYTCANPLLSKLNESKKSVKPSDNQPRAFGVRREMKGGGIFSSKSSSQTQNAASANNANGQGGLNEKTIQVTANRDPVILQLAQKWIPKVVAGNQNLPQINENSEGEDEEDGF